LEWVCVEANAIAQGAATATMDRAAHEDEDIEEIDLADLAAIHVKVDAAELQAASRDGIIQEVFTGIYNQVDSVQYMASPSASPMLDNLPNLKPISTYPITDLSYTIKIQLWSRKRYPAHPMHSQTCCL
jgi:hypothetical protein